MKDRDQIKVQKAAVTLSYTTAFIPTNTINLQQQGQNTNLTASLAEILEFSEAKFLLAFACVDAGVRDFKAEPCLQATDFIYSINWLCFQGCRYLGTCGSGRWCEHAASGSPGSATFSEEPVTPGC